MEVRVKQVVVQSDEIGQILGLLSEKGGCSLSQKVWHSRKSILVQVKRIIGQKDRPFSIKICGQREVSGVEVIQNHVS